MLTGRTTDCVFARHHAVTRSCHASLASMRAKIAPVSATTVTRAGRARAVRPRAPTCRECRSRSGPRWTGANPCPKARRHSGSSLRARRWRSSHPGCGRGAADVARAGRRGRSSCVSWHIYYIVHMPPTTPRIPRGVPGGPSARTALRLTAQFVPRNDSRFHSTMPHDADHRAPSAAPLSRRDFVAATGAAAVGGPLARLLPPMPAPQPMSTRESPEPAVQDPRALSLIDLATAIRSGRLTSEATVRAYLDRIEVVNPTLNAVVQLRRDAALAEARIADRVPMEKRGALHGVPVTIKDSLDTAGIISTGGTMGRASYVPAEDATVVKRLRAAGAIILGKTNTPDVTLAFETNNLVYGRTNNPYDVSRTSHDPNRFP